MLHAYLLCHVSSRRITLSRLIWSVLTIAMAGAPAIVRAQRPLPEAPAFVSVDRASFDTTCAPCQDFYRFANGGWMATATIPASLPMWGTLIEVVGRSDSLLHDLAEQARMHATSTPTRGRRSDEADAERKLGVYYGSCMDSTRAESDGLAPLQPVFGRIAAMSAVPDITKTLIALRNSGQVAAFGFGAGEDPKHAPNIMAVATQGGMGLPTPGLYRDDNPRARQLRDAYVAHVSRLLALAGEPSSTAADDAARVLEFETRLASAASPPAAGRDPLARYHPMDRPALRKLTPHFDWAGLLTALSAPQARMVNVENPAFFAELDSLIAHAPVATWRAYLRAQVLNAAAPDLTAAFAAEAFAWGRMFTGASAPPPRWKRCVQQITRGPMGELLGRAYVREHFSPEARARAVRLVADVEETLRSRLAALAWMSPATKTEAIAKLAALRTRVGYPDRWRDVSGLDVRAGPSVLNRMHADVWAIRHVLRRVGMSADTTEWSVPPQLVDAIAGGGQITIPAGILQPPLFDPAADDASNFGAIAVTIGHELTHQFDDNGRRYDARGNLRDWWTPTDATEYQRRSARLIAQFDAYTIGDSATHVNGKLTLGENIADLGGIVIAFEAMERALGRSGKRQTVDGFTPEQRFFLSYARVWRSIARPEYQRSQVATDPHAPWMLRVNGPLSNLEVFARAFGCKAGDAMVRPDSARVVIW